MIAHRDGIYEKEHGDQQYLQEYADEQNHAVYSIDESFVDVTDSLKLFGARTQESWRE